MKILKKEKENNIYINFDIDYKFDFDIYKLSKKIIKEVFEVEKIKGIYSVNISIVTKNVIKKLNFKNRNINKITDVLSFPNIKLNNRNEFKKLVNAKNSHLFYDYDSSSIFLGDVIICYDKIISQSKKYNHSIKREYSFLLTHSILHLIGYDHMKKVDEDTMFKKQDLILSNLNINR